MLWVQSHTCNYVSKCNFHFLVSPKKVPKQKKKKQSRRLRLKTSSYILREVLNTGNSETLLPLANSSNDGNRGMCQAEQMERPREESMCEKVLWLFAYIP